MTLEEIELKLKKAHEDYDNAFRNLPLDLSWEQFDKHLNPYSSEVHKWSREKRLLLIPEMVPISKYGDKMTLEKFIEHVNSGGFIDYDGSGNYATETEESNISIYPSDIKANKYRKDFTHVIWYNK